VKSGETLSGIAASAAGSGANSPQTRSWMLAIYQANPPAFEKNMNLLRSGAVLRIPEIPLCQQSRRPRRTVRSGVNTPHGAHQHRPGPRPRLSQAVCGW